MLMKIECFIRKGKNGERGNTIPYNVKIKESAPLLRSGTNHLRSPSLTNAEPGNTTYDFINTTTSELRLTINDSSILRHH